MDREESGRFSSSSSSPPPRRFSGFEGPGVLFLENWRDTKKGERGEEGVGRKGWEEVIAIGEEKKSLLHLIKSSLHWRHENGKKVVGCAEMGMYCGHERKDALLTILLIMVTDNGSHQRIISL